MIQFPLQLITLGLVVAVGCSTPAFGQGSTDAPGILAPDAPRVPADEVEISASDLMGKPVIDAAGDSLGQVADVIITTTGEVKRLVISSGAFGASATRWSPSTSMRCASCLPKARSWPAA